MVMFKESLSTRSPSPGTPSRGHCKGQRYLPPSNNLNSEERMGKEERKTSKKEEWTYLRESGNPAASPRFTSALRSSWLPTRLPRDQVSLFLGAKELSRQRRLQRPHRGAASPPNRLRSLLSPHHSPCLQLLQHTHSGGRPLPLPPCTPSPAKEERMPP